LYGHIDIPERVGLKLKVTWSLRFEINTRMRFELQSTRLCIYT